MKIEVKHTFALVGVLAAGLSFPALADITVDAELPAGTLFPNAVNSHSAVRTEGVSPEQTIRIGPDSSLESVRDKIRGMRLSGVKGAVNVILTDGTYRFSRPIQFALRDSQVSYRAEHAGCVRFTGGLPLPRAKPYSGSVLVADLKSAGIVDYGSPKVGNDERVPEGLMPVWKDAVMCYARWPNDGFAAITNCTKETAKQRFGYVDARIDRWVGEHEPCANGFFAYNWAADRIDIGSIDPANRTIGHGKCGSLYGYSDKGFWFGYNLFCELDVANEFYLDRKDGKLYFIPPDGGRDGVCEVTMSTGLVAIKGAKDLSFDGIVFENCRGTAMTADNCTNIVVSSCVFRNAGMLAVEAVRNEGFRLVNCDIRRCGRGGVKIDGGDADRLRPSGNLVENCVISDYSLGQLTYGPAVRVNGCGTTLRSNTIHDGPHVAVLFSGRCHLFESNDVHRVCLVSGEMGAFYCGRDWTLVGNHVRCNYVHDIPSPRSQPNRAFMWDDGAAGIFLYANILRNVEEGVSLSGIGNHVEWNVFFNVNRPISCWQAWTTPERYKPGFYTHASLLDRFYSVPFDEEPWRTRYPYLKAIDVAMKTGVLRDPSTRTSIKGNYVVNARESTLTAGFAWDPICDKGWNVGVNTRVDGLTFEEAMRRIGKSSDLPYGARRK